MSDPLGGLKWPARVVVLAVFGVVAGCEKIGDGIRKLKFWRKKK